MMLIELTKRLFFFSSRRRHTRSLCDWRSDVCSSDLSLPFRQDSILLSCALRRRRLALSLRPLTVCLSASALLSLGPSLMLRRRVPLGFPASDVGRV